MKFYALEQIFGNISIYSEYGRPYLHVFDSKRERDNFVNDYESIDVNHSAEATTSKVAYGAYTHIVDGVRTFGNQVIVH